ncbi:YpoC family protein [Fictibacillus barbaricus]|uniref:YpoC-like domain-containing protein n=1 Tax=Fictibacillus barbaricus TaxID=182136 RepID=A0ABU1TZ58_9BACL|nr:hypothetical protein [Fictibacillus barbaricus]MDR7072505.1 hypothetical protein [Fictibacillus barbaricus]
MESNPLSQSVKQSLVFGAFKEWKEASPLIADFFRQRNRELTRKPMIFHAEGFLKTLFWVNNKPFEDDLSEWKERINGLNHLPVNAIERLSFIFDQPDHYQSYIQLSELFTEWEKKSVILMRRKA